MIVDVLVGVLVIVGVLVDVLVIVDVRVIVGVRVGVDVLVGVLVGKGVSVAVTGRPPTGGYNCSAGIGPDSILSLSAPQPKVMEAAPPVSRKSIWTSYFCPCTRLMPSPYVGDKQSWCC